MQDLVEIAAHICCEEDSTFKSQIAEQVSADMIAAHWVEAKKRLKGLLVPAEIAVVFMEHMVNIVCGDGLCRVSVEQLDRSLDVLINDLNDMSDGIIQRRPRDFEEYLDKSRCDYLDWAGGIGELEDDYFYGLSNDNWPTMFCTRNEECYPKEEAIDCASKRSYPNIDAPGLIKKIKALEGNM